MANTVKKSNCSEFSVNITRAHKIEYQSGKIIERKPSYYSIMDGNDHRAVLFNCDNTLYYKNGIPDDEEFITLGESFTNCRIYEEGITHSYDYVLWDMGYTNYLGFTIGLTETRYISCNSPTGLECPARGTYTATINYDNYVGDLTYTWTAVGGSVVSGQGTDTAVIETLSANDKDVVVKVVISDYYTQSEVSRIFTHEREHRPWAGPLYPRVKLYPTFNLYPRG